MAETNNPVVTGENLSKDDIYDLLADDKSGDVGDKEEKTKEPDKAPKEDDKELELDETDKEAEIEELPDEEVEEEKEPDEFDLVVPARKKEILTKYPNLFKDFPFLERAYYVDKQYTEMFGTISDAKQVIERSNTLGEFEKQLEQGNTEPILKTIKENDPAAFGKLVDNYMSDLHKVDQNAYIHVLGNFGKQTILQMAQEGNRLNNEHLKAAAVVLNQFLFGTSNFEPAQKFSKDAPQDNQERQQLQSERQSLVREKFEAVRDDLSTKATNVLKSTIDNHIDPKGVMTDYVKRNAVRDCMSNLENMIGQDRPFRIYLDKMWSRAADSNFSRDSIEQIRKAYLSKAKTYLKDAISKARNEALSGPSKGSNEPQKDKRGPISPGRSASQANSGNDKKGTVPKGMKTIDYLMQD